MTTLLEIKEAFSHLPQRDRAILTAELFAQEEPDAVELEMALEKGLNDVRDGRIRPLQDVKRFRCLVDYKVLITDAALDDLKGIVSFIAEDDAYAAVRVGERLIDRALSLGTMPSRCPYLDSVRGIRKMTTSPFIIDYLL